MIEELDTVVLTIDIPEKNLVKGDIGTVVHVYKDCKGVEIEFVSGEGKTVGVETLTESEVRTMNAQEILHVRELNKT
jgi:ATP-dependent exoDNAse (exonuclease V) alpha subunit